MRRGRRRANPTSTGGEQPARGGSSTTASIRSLNAARNCSALRVCTETFAAPRFWALKRASVAAIGTSSTATTRRAFGAARIAKAPTPA